MELTADIIKRRSGHYDLSLVALLDVSQMRIRRLGQLESCLNLLELNLAHNELRSLDGLPSLPLLRCLHLANNQLTSLDNLPFLPLLEELSVADNQIRSLDYTALASKLPSLRALNFNGNPLDSSASAKASKAFPDLFILNGEALTLTRLLEEISSDDFGKSPADDADIVQESIELEYAQGLDVTQDDDIGVNAFISESTRHLEELLLRCKQTLAASEPELIFPASPGLSNAPQSS
ncbi:Leucine-rich repeat-containing protein 61 [Phytophthora ramorum]|uniref:Leucine-rich repeat-containing protein 61 n=1 Tax=Phytophthora ramorum TaxID=164328 RepID=UPI0030A47AF8|nr:Leucine-rich repeat-containing protein 61 [Phytophthora ramorum]